MTRRAKIWFHRQYVKCGKEGCKSCPHGPYWYGSWKEEGKTRTKYYGKFRPTPETETHKRWEPDRTQKIEFHPHDAIFNRSTASNKLAFQILGLKGTQVDVVTLKRVYRDLTAKNHPDKGGSTIVMQRVNAAYSWLHAKRH